MLSLLASLLNFLPSVTNAISSITTAITNEKIAALNATTQQDQIASSERIAALQTQRDALIAESTQSKLPIYMQTLIAAGPAFILSKIFFYDKLGFGTTEIANDSPLWWVIMSVVGFYFLHNAWTKK